MEAAARSMLVDLLGAQQPQGLPALGERAVDTFSRYHDREAESERRSYRALIPLKEPAQGERYAFHVDLDACTGCKACVTACHNLNGLDEDEVWRKVGTLEPPMISLGQGLIEGSQVTGSQRIVENFQLLENQQIVTSACHHCEDPACLTGCPVQAYEQNSTTGIVRHLDDQCIGCQYCVLMCPYEVPTYSKSRGIVRKCDLCQNRLSHGEAPACAQGCPNQAISIHLVPWGGTGFELPDAPDPSITRPTTRFRSSRSLSGFKAVDRHVASPGKAHWPLVVMLTGTQLGVGCLLGGLLLSEIDSRLAALLAGWVLLILGLGSSLVHIGHPGKSWRVFLGLGTSWLSREVVVLGGCFGAYTASLAMTYFTMPGSNGLAAVALGLGLMGIFCSGQLYHVTRRSFWQWRCAGLSFWGATLQAAAYMIYLAPFSAAPLSQGALFANLALLLIALTGLLVPSYVGWSLLRRSTWDLSLDRSWKLLTEPLLPWVVGRLSMAVVVVFTCWLGFVTTFERTWIGSALALAIGLGVLLERYLFFTAVAPLRMPGEG